MATNPTIQLKRKTSGSGAPASLSAGEPAFNTTQNFLYVGNGSAVKWVGAEILDSSTSTFTSDTQLATRKAVGDNFLLRTTVSSLTLGSGAQVRFTETGGGTDYVALQAPAAVSTSNVIYTLPGAYPGSAGYVLQADTSGNMSWAAPSSSANVGVTATSTSSLFKMLFTDVNATNTSAALFIDTTSGVRFNPSSGQLSSEGSVTAPNVYATAQLQTPYIDIQEVEAGHSFSIGDVANAETIFASSTVANDFTQFRDISTMSIGNNNYYTYDVFPINNGNAIPDGPESNSFAYLNIGNGGALAETNTGQSLYKTINIGANTGTGNTTYINLGSATGVNVTTIYGTMSVVSNITTGGDMAVNGGDITSTATSFNLLNATVTNANVLGAANTIVLGGTGGTATIRNAATRVNGTLTVTGATVLQGAASFNSTLTVTGATVVQGALSTNGALSVTGTSTLIGDVTASGDIAVNGGDITSTATTFNLLNTTVTNANVLGAAQRWEIGAAGGSSVAAIRNNSLQLGNTTSGNAAIYTHDVVDGVFGGSQPLTIKPDGNLIFTTYATGGPGGTTPSVILTATDEGLGSTRVAGGDLFLGSKTDASSVSSGVNLTFGYSTATINTTSTGTTANVFNTNVTTANAFGAATTLIMGAASGTTTIRNAGTNINGTLTVTGATVLQGALTLNSSLTVTGATTFQGALSTNSTLSVTSNATFASNIIVNGGSIQTTSSTFNLITNTASIINIGTVSGSSINIGNGGSTTQLNGNLSVKGSGGTSSIDAGSSAYVNLFNTTITGISFAGSADQIYVGSANSTTFFAGGVNIASAKSFLINGTSVLNTSTLGSTVTDSGLTRINSSNLRLIGSVEVNGGTITSSSTTFNLLNTTVTNANVLGAANTINIGSSLATINLGTGTTGANVYVKGNLFVQGATTTISSTTVSIADLNITLADGQSTTAGVNGAGITLGSTGITWQYNNTGNNWESTENISIATGKTFKINNSAVLSSTVLGSSVTSASGIVQVGTIGLGTWQGTTIGVAYGGTGLTTYTTGAVVYATAATTLANLAPVSTSGAVLSSTGLNSNPEYKTITLSYGTVTSASNSLSFTIQNAVADGTTKGVATFNSTQFDDASGVITLDTIDGGTYA